MTRDLSELSALTAATRLMASRVNELVANENFDASGKRVVIISGRYNKIGTPIETVVGLALAKRSADVRFVICDQIMPACDARRADRDTLAMCEHCASQSALLLRATGLPTFSLSRWVNSGDLELCSNEVDRIPREDWLALKQDGVALGKIAYSSTLRYFLRSSLSREIHWGKFRTFLVTGLLMKHIAYRMFEDQKPDVIFISHGIYVTWGVFTEVAASLGIRVVVYGYGYRRGTILLSEGETYHTSLLNESVDAWAAHPLTPEESERITKYLQSKVNGGLDWIAYNDRPSLSSDRLREQLGIPDGKRVIGFFLNIPWDAAVVMRHATFASMREWLKASLDVAQSRKDIEWVFRCHPAEEQFTTEEQETAMDIIHELSPDLPDHIHILPPDAPVNTYDLAGVVDTAVVYTTKVGLEFATRGLPVIVCGEAFFRGKGFTYDPHTPTDYTSLLCGPLLLPNTAQAQLALRYAHHYFFSHYMDLPGLGDQGIGKPVLSIDIDDLDAIGLGNPQMDMICQRIFGE